MRIAVLTFMHETVTFLSNDTTTDDFLYPGSPCKGEALLSTRSNASMAGFVRCAREFADVELVGIESPLFPKTGTGSGWIAREAFEHFAGIMVRALTAQGPFDGVYMALHGAMAVRGVARPEAELAARVRHAVGRAATIAATFDPHGNEDEAFFASADLGFCAKYYPHYDMHLQGERAARTLVRAIRGTYVPQVACIKVPILSPTVVQWTGAPPWMDVVQRALVWEARQPDSFVNVFFGFPWADTPDAGMAVQVTTDGDLALAQCIARDMASFVWRQREALVSAAQVHGIDEGVAMAGAAVEQGAVPIVIADHSDRSGHATWVLKRLLERSMKRVLIASVADGKLVGRLVAEGVQPGDRFDEAVGGMADASSGEPVRISGTVLAVGEGLPGGDGRGLGTWVAVGFGEGNVLVVSAFLMQIVEPSQLEKMGFQLSDFDVFVIKSRVHFRRGFHDSGFSPCILLVQPEQPFLGTTRLEALPYQHLRLADFYPFGRERFAP
ncbi:M81 family metallopeptidase [Hydrogenophaga sp. BPS33]|uniref:M81 family metallopeptidase n=1 Tax=Hydrogenophaga sp. BPS33 TaxID=2651974 RepID=UPI00131FBC78|nr:M81 family metallopeptidase [Hydrogenophaga sp. BPS33]QHE87743.1 M81 family metallopeptidase [Hydrogenophaga sp. BPS33]